MIFTREFLWDWLAVWIRLMTSDHKSNIIDVGSHTDTSPNVSRHVPKANYLVSLVTALISLVVMIIADILLKVTIKYQTKPIIKFNKHPYPLVLNSLKKSQVIVCRVRTL